MEFDLYNHLNQFEMNGPRPPLQGVTTCSSEEECLDAMRKLLSEVREELERRTDWLPFSYKAYFYGAVTEEPDCLYFCITDDPLENLGQPLDCLHGAVMPDWFYVRIHIVKHSHMHMKIISPMDRLIRCRINCKDGKEMVKPISCLEGQHMKQVDESLMQYMQTAFPA